MRADGTIVRVRDQADVERDENGERELWRSSWTVIAEPEA